MDFWHHHWNGQRPLYLDFPTLFDECRNNHVRVTDLSSWDNNVWLWNFPWSHFDDPLLGEEDNILSSILQDVVLKAGCDDYWFWILESSKIFTVRSCYNHLVKARLVHNEDSSLNLALKGL